MEQNWYYLAIFITTQLIPGLINGSIGPLIPYLAADSGRSQTDYSFIFVSRTVGVLLGAIIYKTLQYFNLVSKHYHILAITSVVVCIGCASFYYFQILFAEGIILGLISGSSFFQNIAINCSILIVAPKQKIFQWLSFVHGSYGVGSLIAPILVSFLKTKYFFVPGTLALCLVPIYFVLNAKLQKVNVSQNYVQEAQTQPLRLGSTYLTVFLGLNFFITHGLESLTGGWISSYLTMSGLGDKVEASIFATCFWSLFTLFRFISGFVDVKASTKLKRISQLGVLSLGLSILLALLDHKKIATWVCAIMQGISISGIFPLTLTLPYEYNIKISDSQISNLMIVMMVSEAVVTAPTGILMKKVCLQMFFYSIMFYNIIFLINTRYLVSILQQDQGIQYIQAEQQIK